MGKFWKKIFVQIWQGFNGTTWLVWFLGVIGPGAHAALRAIDADDYTGENWEENRKEYKWFCFFLSLISGRKNEISENICCCIKCWNDNKLFKVEMGWISSRINNLFRRIYFTRGKYIFIYINIEWGRLVW